MVRVEGGYELCLRVVVEGGELNMYSSYLG